MHVCVCMHVYAYVCVRVVAYPTGIEEPPEVGATFPDSSEHD